MPIVMIKSQRYPGLGTSKRSYPANIPLNISAEELTYLRNSFEKLQDLEILEKPEVPGEAAPNVEAAALAIESLAGQPSNQLAALDECLRQFAPYPQDVNEMLWSRLMRANITDLAKRAVRDFIADLPDWT
jgi:hypothetical protein